MTKSYDDKRDLAIVDDPVQYSCDYFLKIAKEAIEKEGQFSVALSGGSTPKALYNKLKDYKDAIDWSKVLVFFSDERSVGPNDPDSNFHMAMTNGFADLPIPTDHIFRMKAETNAHENAALYENIIKSKLKNESFDLILLGMGDDGHTASLFPGTDALNETSKLIVENNVPQKNTLRMTFTYPLIAKAKHIFFLVTGDGKADMVQKVLSDKEQKYPSGKVFSEKNKVLWILDEKSSANLSS
ncbi:MAG: 6-phosphogluconolactonase [Chlamydiia bacterium]|nr:6-phosphogluconolactonase [Chlamydiia bacterium]